MQTDNFVEKLKQCKTREHLIKYIFHYEFEVQLYEAPPGRREHLQEIMNKMIDLWPEVINEQEYVCKNCGANIDPMNEFCSDECETLYINTPGGDYPEDQ